MKEESDEREPLPENNQQNEIPEENLNNMNTEENVIYNNPPTSSSYIPVQSSYNMPPSNSDVNVYATPMANSSSNQKASSSADTNSLWYDLSIFSWILLLWTTYNYFRNSKLDMKLIFIDNNTIGINFLSVGADLSLPLAITSVISTIGFIIYFKNTTLKKNQSIINGLLGDITKYHSIAFLLVSCLFLTLDSASKTGTFAMGLVLSLFSCGLLGFIYFKTDFSGEWYEIITTKKGVYSCVISLS